MLNMSALPETKVLAIASHVSYGYVGNTMATFVMQSLGAEVSAINTVCYSNHTAYKQVKGRKVPAEEILDLYEGLKQSFLTDFNVLLSGYVPSAEAVEAVGKIARDLKHESNRKPGSFFWVLDPVMGDNGKLYIPESEVPAYKSLLRYADLILPNQFEAELLSEVKITNLSTLATAIKALHTRYNTPHIIITSLRLSKVSGRTLPGTTAGNTTHAEEEDDDDVLSVIGSSSTSKGEPRLWRIDIPAYPVFFSGTGDMFAALMVVRLREAAAAAGLLNTSSWRSPDDVPATETPLAKAATKVLASMQSILGKTYQYYKTEVSEINTRCERAGKCECEDATKAEEMRMHLKKTKAAEVRVVRNAKDLIEPSDLDKYAAKAVEVEF
ncbi:pyridoxal kinase [Verruconis gallopava]|uniref:pyridoxal kinase n=1 Tax=Verruconis gallopava TaxID=253628 RepID=A0A0D1Z4V9_9PEZI|nr:pyridoxal kinase [Verruconis gallopava]KIW07982.1 pyridoxal kinase [Verruconis gallopava]